MYRINHGVSFEHQFVLVVDVGELFLGDIDSAFRYKVDLSLLKFEGRDYVSFFEFVVEGVDLVVESCGADFPGFIKEIDGEQTALSTLIMPLFDFGFISHANSDRPSIVSQKSYLGVLVLIWGESFNRVHSDVSTDISNARNGVILRRSGLLHLLLLLALLGCLLLLSLSIHIRPV
jgi:hypothetical protein